MRSSKLFLPTLREDPAEAEVISHKLLIRAGFIRKLATGIFSYLPLGLLTLRKIENIVRREMLRAGAQEVLLPMVQPAELWLETSRWDKYGNLLLRFKDRQDRDYCLGPTHEEVITDIVRKDIRSYRDLPINLFQIQTKFRDEIRPRFGLMRGREFGMKDAYSFDLDEAGADQSYAAMYQAYVRIFQRCGLRFAAVEADSGDIGGDKSQEFMVLAETGEDAVVNCPSCGYAANTEKAQLSAPPDSEVDTDLPAFEKVLTKDKHTVEQVTAFLNVEPEDLIKTLVYETDDSSPVAVLVRGDHEINELKLKKALQVEEVELAGPAVVEEVTKAPVGFAGPVGIDIRILADNGIKTLTTAVVGANEADYHLTGVVPGRDFEVETYYDLRVARAGDACFQCGNELKLMRGIEVGHVFILGTYYSDPMQATFLDPEGKERSFYMGCYGLGIGRTMAAAIEQNHDENGIIWPIPLAPFEVIILPLQNQDDKVEKAAVELYGSLWDLGVEALLDDRDVRAGVKFNDADLIGIPLRVAISKRTLEKDQVEFKERTSSEMVFMKLSEAPHKILEIRDKMLRALNGGD